MEQKAIMNDLKFGEERLWSLVLAGGNGERPNPLLRHWMGRHTPKQYCTFIGTRSLFQHAMDRSDRIISPERRVTIIAQDHLDEASPQFASRSIGNLILQPANRDTAVGVFLGIARVRALDPEASVLILPSDHFIYPENRFVEIARNMVSMARQMKHWIYLLGASPDGPEREYDWVQPGAHLACLDGCRVRLSRAFLEKPSLTNCKAAMASGALWNTMITAAKVETLWNLGRRFLPEVINLFEAYSKSIGSEEEDRVLEDIYKEMPKRNFSSDFLKLCSRQVLVMELNDVVWSDWSNPERITSTLRRMGHEPEACWARLAAAAG
jgi:mannose-1-phosphate guanylyltransferase